jgi:hypothetical protein
MLAVTVSLVACTSGAERREASRATTWRSVAAWSGTGNKTLETFPIGAGRLRVHWETRNLTADNAAHLRMRLHSADSGRVLDEVVDGRGIVRGSKDVIDEHQRFYLSVESSGVEWTVRVEEGLAAR